MSNVFMQPIEQLSSDRSICMEFNELVRVQELVDKTRKRYEIALRDYEFALTFSFRI